MSGQNQKSGSKLMRSHLEARVPPQWWGHLALSYFIATLVVVFSFLSVFDVLWRVTFIAPLLWLGLIGYLVWGEIKREGAYRAWAISFACTFVGEEFITIASQDGPNAEISNEMELFGHRYVRWGVPLDKIVSVECSSGQAKGWYVCLWFKNASSKGPWKPGQSVQCIGPERRKTDTEKFCVAIVELLQRGGLSLRRHEAEQVAGKSSGSAWHRIA